MRLDNHILAALLSGVIGVLLLSYSLPAHPMYLITSGSQNAGDRRSSFATASLASSETVSWAAQLHDLRRVSFSQSLLLWIAFVVVLISFLTFIGKDIHIAKIDDELLGTNALVEGDPEAYDQMLIVGHNNLPVNIAKFENNNLQEFDLQWDLQRHSTWGQLNTSRTDLIRLRKGQVKGQVWFVEANCSQTSLEAAQDVLDQIDTLKRLIEKHSKDLSLATSVAGLRQDIAQGKIASLIAVKGGHSINSKLGLLRSFYSLGVRCMSLASEHNCCSWADASTVDELDNGIADTRHDLSIWGRLVVWEMNRLGMIVDLSYASYGVALDVLRYSRAPVIYSNAGAYKINRHHMNVKDDVLTQLATRGGLIMLSFDPIVLGGYTIDNILEHLNYLRDTIGADHIGIGSGFDGFDNVLEGLEDVSKFPALFDVLAGGKYSDGESFPAWSPEELRNLAGLNFLRMLHRVEQVREELSYEQPFEDAGMKVIYD